MRPVRGPGEWDRQARRLLSECLWGLNLGGAPRGEAISLRSVCGARVGLDVAEGKWEACVLHGTVHLRTLR